MHKIQLKSLAKINLGLDVIGKRDNGYHDVRMIMQTIYLYDDVVIEKRKGGKITIESNLFFLPIDENNIAYKAAQMLKEQFKIEDGVHIRLHKRIPVAAGLAGGSSNAAAVLWGMNQLFQLNLQEKDLMELGVKLGADVPYCIMRGTVLAEGIGEILTPLSPMPNCYIVIAKPGISVSTKVVYEKLDGSAIVEHPNIDEIIAGLEQGDLVQVAENMGNVLEQVTIEDYPVIEEIKTVMKENGAVNAMMSGSGPTVFGIFTKKQEANNAIQGLKRKAIARQIYLTNIHNNVRRS